MIEQIGERVRESTNQRVVIILGSELDLEFVQPMVETLKQFEVKCELRIASAHKTSRHLLEMLEQYESEDADTVYITVAGKSNGLGGVVAANTRFPVITCPPLSVGYESLDIWSSLRMPSGVPLPTVLDPTSAALFAIRVCALNNPELVSRLHKYNNELSQKVIKADAAIRNNLQT